MKLKRKNKRIRKKHLKIDWEWAPTYEELKEKQLFPAWYFAHGFIRIGERVYQLKGFEK